ncbi:MAG: carbamoyl-phosphate synthase large subunit, partial [Herminiimonas sp.]|nr:carbamoyl-phosphate synthase large subunit [Herminiimonas sp.]
MTILSLLIANRGEIAIRIARAAAELGIRTVALFAEDDAASLHVCKTDDAIGLRGSGAASYLDGEQIIAAALAAGCDAIHPGYGFLSENAGFAQGCIDAGLVFVGPPPAVLALFGNKLQAKALAERHRIPVAGGPSGAASVDEIHAFYSSLGSDAAIMIKAVAGGGGRGMRAVHDAAQIDEAYLRCRSEAAAAFGNDAVYAERLLPNARHIEVQIIGDGHGGVSHLWDRECSLQRRHQKLVEIAPSPTLLPALRARIIDAALCLARAVQYQSLGTFEFLLDGDDATENAPFIFMEANPRLQVEHTVTEEVTGVDLVKAQLQLAGGASLAELGLTQNDIRPPIGFAMQLRVNMETMQADGSVIPAGGRLDAFEPPTGPGVRVDTAGYAGYVTSAHYDSLLAKVIAHSTSPCYADTVARAYRALSEFRIEGVATNIAVLQNLLSNDAVIANRVHIRFIETHLAQLLAPQRDVHRKRYFDTPPISARPSRSMIGPEESNGAVAVNAPMQGSVVSIDVQAGDAVHSGQQLGVMEAMKMEHVITANASGVVQKISVLKGDVVFAGDALLYIALTEIAPSAKAQAPAIDLDLIRPDLAEVRMRHDIGLDAFRADAVARRRKTGQRTARENIADLCDADSFIEYGGLAIAGQRTRRPIDELIRISPADGLVSGIGAVNGTLFDEHHARCMILAYDYTVFAGTQGAMNHKKTDRMLQLAQDWKLPIIFFTEGGGGRPGDVDAQLVAGLDCTSFYKYAALSGLVPRVGIVSGRCFAGNAAFLGCSDVIIAT